MKDLHGSNGMVRILCVTRNQVQWMISVELLVQARKLC